MEIVSEFTVVRESVDSNTSLITVSVVVEVVVEIVVVEVDVMISSTVSEIKTSQDAVCSCLLCDLNQAQHFLNTDTAIDSRLIARMISPTILRRKKIVSDSKSYSSYSLQIHISMLQASW